MPVSTPCLFKKIPPIIAQFIKILRPEAVINADNNCHKEQGESLITVSKMYPQQQQQRITVAGGQEKNSVVAQ